MTKSSPPDPMPPGNPTTTPDQAALATDSSPRQTQPSPPESRDPLHGLTLEAIVTALVGRYGWPGLGQRLPIRCFLVDPSIKSSLVFLRRTPWARAKVESLYLFMQREQRRDAR